MFVYRLLWLYYVGIKNMLSLMPPSSVRMFLRIFTFWCAIFSSAAADWFVGLQQNIEQFTGHVARSCHGGWSRDPISPVVFDQRWHRQSASGRLAAISNQL